MESLAVEKMGASMLALFSTVSAAARESATAELSALAPAKATESESFSEIDLTQPFFRDRLTLKPAADLVILTIDTTQIAPGKKDSSRPPCPADTGFFPKVKSGPGNYDIVPRTAETAGAGNGTLPGTVDASAHNSRKDTLT